MEEPIEHLPLSELIPYIPKKVVAKFYRPGRWTEQQIKEEHAFIWDCVDSEIPAIAPLKNESGQTLHLHTDTGLFYALFPKVGGRAPEELQAEDLEIIGRLLARIHQVGASKPAPNRLTLNTLNYGLIPLGILKEKACVPQSLEREYFQLTDRIIKVFEHDLSEAKTLRVHGDCHLGNLLWNRQKAFFLDFDDMLTAPAVQDIWMVIPGRDPQSKNDLEILLESYEKIRSFDRAELKLIEGLRALRIIHYSAWIAKRWEDPSFPNFSELHWPRLLERRNAAT